MTTVMVVRCPKCANEVGRADVTPEIELTVTYNSEGVAKSYVEVNQNLYKQFPHNCEESQPTDEG